MKDKNIEEYKARREAVIQDYSDKDVLNINIGGAEILEQLAFEEGKRRILETALKTLRYNQGIIEDCISRTITELEELKGGIL